MVGRPAIGSNSSIRDPVLQTCPASCLRTTTETVGNCHSWSFRPAVTLCWRNRLSDSDSMLQTRRACSDQTGRLPTLTVGSRTQARPMVAVRTAVDSLYRLWVLPKVQRTIVSYRLRHCTLT